MENSCNYSRQIQSKLTLKTNATRMKIKAKLICIKKKKVNRQLE